MKKKTILFFSDALVVLLFLGGILVAQKESEKKGTIAGIFSEINKDSISSGNNSGVGTTESSFSFGILGDSQMFEPDNPNGELQKAVSVLSSKNVSFVMAEGDLLSSCDGKSECEAKLNSWKNALGSLYPKTYEIMGNHDRTGKDKSDVLWQKFFSLPSNGPQGYSELAYSFNYKNSHFVVLNSEKPDENVVNGTQRSWLEQDLNANKKENTFVFFHEPAYPTNSKIGESLDADPKERNALWNILSSHNVKAVFSGHEHIASRKKIGSVYQFVFGNTDSFNHEAPKPGMAEWSYVGESFAIVEVAEKNVKVDSYSAGGKLLDSFSF